MKTIWDADRPLIDKVSQTLSLGDPAAAKLLEEAREPGTPAPTSVPALFKDDKKSDFFRANLALAYSQGADRPQNLRGSAGDLGGRQARGRRRSGRLLLPQGGLRVRPHAQGQGRRQYRSASRGRDGRSGTLSHGRGSDALRHDGVAGKGPGLDRSQDGQHPAPARSEARRQARPRRCRRKFSFVSTK